MGMVHESFASNSTSASWFRISEHSTNGASQTQSIRALEYSYASANSSAIVLLSLSEVAWEQVSTCLGLRFQLTMRPIAAIGTQPFRESEVEHNIQRCCTQCQCLDLA